MYFISECTLFRNRIKYIFLLSGCSGGVVLGEKIKYIFKSLHFGNFINSGIKWVTRIPKAAVIITEDINEFENMIHRFKSNITNWHGEFVDSMTVSYGWVFSTEGNWDSIYEISKAADERMYESKERFYNESGVNRR